MPAVNGPDHPVQDVGGGIRRASLPDPFGKTVGIMKPVKAAASEHQAG